MRTGEKMKKVSLLASVVLLAVGGLGFLTPGSVAAQGTHKRVEERSDAFRKVVDRSLDRSALNGTNREDNINEQIKELENAIDTLRRDFDRAQTWEESRSQVQRVMNEADEVNAIVRRGRWRRGGPVKAEWALVRADLNKLAGIYNLRLLIA
jgi:Ni/Co efflux regulator RcnB